MHGLQFQAQDKRRLPTAYFGPESGVGVAVRHVTASPASSGQGGLQIGVIGLGVGTVAAYGRTGDHVRFYEINPDDIRIARDTQCFTFLSDSLAQVDVIPGDGRLSLERELADHDPDNFDVLVLDAFSGDAIPVHLLTLEAFETYQRHLKMPSGILAIHITNTYLDLRPVVFAAARKLGLSAVFVHSTGDGRVTNPTDWMLVSSPNNPLNTGPSKSASGQDDGDVFRLKTIDPWTDDYSNLIHIIRP